ncbi:MAG: 16S rRNA (guanine(966)-N(2))-methyltransferase RsmD, partial [Cyanobacteria bacterium]|nr:16S rRNA (guanine(966)-N(2))-methyltransferase RsmD [Cyanobacteriota bacterium]
MEIRPTLDNVKESIFNVLGEKIIGSKVLDLFSGTGSLGIEALSRGCELVYFVDKSLGSIKLIRKNLENLENIENKYKVFRSEILQFLKKFQSINWDIIFIDPPYKIESDIMKKIFEICNKKIFTTEKTIIIYEFFLWFSF